MQLNRRSPRVFALALAVVPFVLAACGGGGGGSSQPTRYRIAGTVTGLAGSGLVLRSAAGGDVTVSGSTFTFPNELDNGTAYTVTIAQQPTSPWQTCEVQSGSGTINAANAAVTVACTTNRYQVGGTVSGLAGSGLVLSDGAEDLPVSADGTFAFVTKPESGTAYAVTVKTQPASPSQNCTVANGSGTLAGADVSNVAVTCSTNAYTLSGTVSGAAVAGLVLHSNVGQGEDVTVPANGTAFAFTTPVPSGTAYAVTVKTQPGTLTCDVANGAGTMGDANVTGIQVTCAQNTYTVGGTVSGLTASGLTLRNSAGSEIITVNSGASSFLFTTRVPSGGAYSVTVATQPTGLQCSVTNGTGTVTNANITNVAVACVRSYTVGGTVAGLSIGGLVLHNALGNEDLPVAANATTFTFATRSQTGSAYAVTVKTQPSTSVSCSVSNGTGNIAGADVTSVAVSCTSAVQSWAAPSTWGGVWQDSTTMVQHAHFDASGIRSDKGPTFNFVGGTEPGTTAVTGFPGTGTRYAGGPFPAEAVNYQATNAQALDFTGDFTVCAIVKPDRSRPFDSYEGPIISKSVGDGKYTLDNAGWSLMQMHDSWCFHYEYNDGTGTTHQFMSSIPAFFANQDFHSELSPPMTWPPELGKPNPTVVVVCGGRSGDGVMIAANSWDPASGAVFNLTKTQDQTADNPFAGPYTLDVSGAAPATIGGYHKTSAEFRTTDYASVTGAFAGTHSYNGLIFETAVWNEPATPQNIQAKMAAFFGLPQGATYLRNREALYLDTAGKLRGAGRHAPRLDPAKGYIFGLQGWNRLSYWVEGNAAYRNPMIFTPGENLFLWTPTSGSGGAPVVATDANVRPPNDSRNAGQKVTLPAGASISIDLDQALPAAPGPATPTPHSRRLTWDVSGPVQGQMWIRPASTGTLTVQKTAPQAGHGAACTVLGASGVTCEQTTVNLGALTSGQWSRVSLNGAFTADATASGGETTNKGTLVFTNSGASEISFYAWGVQLTQLGGGANLGSYDPGELMYDWSASRTRDGEPLDDPTLLVDVLKLPPAASTATTGFCIAAEASMPSGLPWAAPFSNARTAFTWVDNADAPAKSLRLQVRGATGPDAGKLCADLTGAAAPLCASIPAGFDDGNKHLVKACLSPSGSLRLYADSSSTALATAATGVTAPDMATGTILVGNGDARAVPGLTPWNGYISRVIVCRDTGAGSDCR